MEFRVYDELPLKFKTMFPRLLQMSYSDSTMNNFKSGGLLNDLYIVLLDGDYNVVSFEADNSLEILVKSVEQSRFIPRY